VALCRRRLERKHLRPGLVCPSQGYMNSNTVNHIDVCHDKEECGIHSAYSSRSCSPVSPISINRESGNESRILSTPARLRAAGADRRPLNKDRPAYDFNLIEPRRNYEHNPDQDL